jgi:pimeloyl-ACP methyl ester carboxylesterase
VDVGGWRLHLHCTGKARAGRPTVILEAGVGDFSVEWSLVQPDVARSTRVCSYDRAGDGWSELGPHPRTFRQIVYELHTLLEAAGERPPYVVVGHSYGGWLVRLYQSTYPAEVAGMVLVEGGADNPWRMLPDGRLVRSAELATGRPVPDVKRTGPLRISDIPPAALQRMRAGLGEASRRANEPPRDKLPPEAQRMRTWALGRLGHVAAAVNPFEHEELAALRADRATREHPLDDLPGRDRQNIREGDGPRVRTADEGSRRDRRLSRNGKHVAGRSDHVSSRASFGVAAIEQVVAAIRP